MNPAPEQITADELEYLKELRTTVEMFRQQVATLNAAEGALRHFSARLVRKYGIGPQDGVNVLDGTIKRAPQAALPKELEEEAKLPET